MPPRSGARATGIASAAIASCDGIASEEAFLGQLSYTYGVRGTTEGGFEIVSEYRGNVTATLARVPGGTDLLIWSGELTGSASVHETQSSDGGGTAKLDGGGPMVRLALPDNNTARMSLIVDLATCTYMMSAITTLSLTRTDENGTKTTSDAPIVMLQQGRGTPLGDWRRGSISAIEGAFPGHSSAWLALNVDKAGFAALGLAVQLPRMTAPGQEVAVGAADVSFVITPQAR